MHKIIYSSLILFLLYLSVANVYAQSTIRGSFRDRDGKVVGSLEVSLKGEKTDAYLTNTDSLGNFSIGIPSGTYKLTCSLFTVILYQNDLNVFSDTDLGVIEIDRLEPMMLRTLEIDEVVVRGSRQVLTVKGDKLLFDVEHTTLNTSAFNALDVLKRTPLLQADNNGNISYNNTPVTIFINGNKMELPSADVANYLKGYNATDIKSIEIQPVSSAQYDASITGAIVNIITKSLRAGYNVNLSSGLIYGRSRNIDNNQNIFFNLGTNKFNVYGNYGYAFNRSEIGKSTTVQELLSEETTYERNLLKYISKSRSHNYITGFTLHPSKAHRFGGEFYGNNYKSPKSSFLDDFNIIQNGIPIAKALSLSRPYRNTSLYKYSGYYSYMLDSLGSSLIVYAGGLRQKSFSTRLAETDYLTGSFEDNKEFSTADATTDMQFYQGDFTKWFRSNSSISVGMKYTATSRKSGYSTDVFDFPNLEWIEGFNSLD